MAHHERLDKATLGRWRAQATILERDAHGDKVLRLADGRILKLFRDKGLLSLRHWLPLSARFARNARALRNRQIPTVSVETLYRLPDSGHCAVLYQPLPGKILRDLGNNGQITMAMAGELGQFIARLHQAGVMFRSLHLGNIVVTDDGRLGLIDIADMRCWPWPLNRWQRQRNFGHFFRYTDNRWALRPELADAIVHSYAAACQQPVPAPLQGLLATHRQQFTGVAP